VFWSSSLTVLSQTFVLDQITGLIDDRFDVDVLAAGTRREATMMHPEIEAHALLDRVLDVNWETPRGSRLLRWARIVCSLLWSSRLGLLKQVGGIFEATRITRLRDQFNFGTHY